MSLSSALLRGAAALLLLATTGAPARAAEPKPKVEATLTVEAGALDRTATPVTVALPPSLSGPLELIDARGRRLPLQVEGAQGIFILPALAKGKSATFQVVRPAGSPAAGITADREGDALVVRAGKDVVFRYQMTGKAPGPEMPAKFVRGGYLHPVFTPRGAIVTDDYPSDHKHHHGIWNAWTSTEFEGRKPDFWNMGSETARNDFASLEVVYSGPVVGGFFARHASTDLKAAPAKKVLDTDWRVLAYRTHDKSAPYFLFDLEWTDRLVGDKPLMLPQYRYGGLGVRGARAWADKTKSAFLTSEGKDRLTGDDTTGRWVHLGGPLDGKPAGLAVLGHPANFRAPEPLRLHPDHPQLCVSPPKTGPFSIEPGKPYIARYRFVVADGAPDKALLERLWNDYAHPPVATVTVK